jgi:phenylalanyl-tRNA synthetase alpha chain
MIDTVILEKEILSAINSANDQDIIEKIRVEELGKKGRISLLMKELSHLSPEDKKEKGSKLNNLKNIISDSISKKKNELVDVELNNEV